MSDYYTASSAVTWVADLPTPFGSIPLEWYLRTKGPALIDFEEFVTLILILIGLCVSLFLLMRSRKRWWTSVLWYCAANVVFLFYPALVVNACRTDGCDFMQPFVVAYPWYFAICEVAVFALPFTAMFRFIDWATKRYERHRIKKFQFS
ncbi:MAG TPA: hypothetical protein VMU25_03155 [Candidatus Paceibacterota bacterium]|nr:hypothetical protein [Candidatus Paceibacterota bacterium]